MTNGDDRVVGAVRLARDLCMGLAAFVVSATGEVLIELSSPEDPKGLGARVAQLARSSLERPGVQGNEPFWNAEILADDESADDSLACVAVPIRAATQWFGLLGVVDTWLPELDDEQRLGLLRLAEMIAQTLGQGAPLRGNRLPPDLGDDVFAPTPPSEFETSAATPWVSETPDTAGLDETSGLGFIDEAVEHLPEGLVVARDDGTVVFANPAVGELTGRLPEEMLGLEVADVLGLPADLPRDPSLLDVPPPGRHLDVFHADGETLALEVTGARFASRAAGDYHVALVREAIERGLSGFGSASILVNLLDALDEGIVVCDRFGTILVSNRSALSLQGLPVDEDLVGQPFPYASGLCSSDGSPLSESHHPMARALHGTVVRAEQLQLSGEDRRHLLASAKPFELDDGTLGALMVLRDVTSQLEEEAWLMHLALHDPLTGLANRYLLLDYLRRVLLQFRTRGGSIALVFLDLDDFKMINDRFGHDVGDEVLVAVGRRIQGAVRSSDIVARLGGDEFVVAHATSDDPGEIDLVVSRIRKTLTAPYQVRGQTLAVSASIGWVAADPRHEDPTTLLVRADREMYRRKTARRRAGDME
jgi:diguanylate cyclase (GGDEF)-like protein/PAS domain S-box-containing protein